MPFRLSEVKLLHGSMPMYLYQNPERILTKCMLKCRLQYLGYFDSVWSHHNVAWNIENAFCRNIFKNWKLIRISKIMRNAGKKGTISIQCITSIILYGFSFVSDFWIVAEHTTFASCWLVKVGSILPVENPTYILQTIQFKRGSSKQIHMEQ